MRMVRGRAVWNEYGALNEPLKVLGVERSLFFVSLTCALVMFIAMDALLLGVITFALFWLVARVATAYDDLFMVVVRETLRNPGGWFDAGDPGTRPWTVVIDESDSRN